MKKHKKGICAAVILCALVLLSGISAIASNDTIEDEMAQKGFGVYEDSQKQNVTKDVDIFGETVTAGYSETLNQSDTPLAQRPDVYGTYDIFNDLDNNMYIYLYDTDVLCGYKKATAFSDQLDETAVISEQDALANANEFLYNHFGQNQTIYQYVKTTYHEQDGVYILEYAYYLNGVKTDDACVVWVRADSGEICAFNTFKFDRYSGYTDLTVDTAATRAQLETKLWDKGVSPLSRAVSYKINDEYLTKDESGNVVVEYEVKYNGEGAPELIQIPV